MCSFDRFRYFLWNFANMAIPSRNDYYYKNRTAILYKKTCLAAPHCFSRADFLSNF